MMTAFRNEFLRRTLAPQIVGTMALISLDLQLRWSMEWISCHGTCHNRYRRWIFLTARHQLGSSFAVKAQARQLVTRGIYSRIRNPMYVFSTLMFLGTVIAYQRPRFLLVPAALIVVQVMRARAEAHVLEQSFGEAYRSYRRRTWF